MHNSEFSRRVRTVQSQSSSSSSSQQQQPTASTSSLPTSISSTSLSGLGLGGGGTISPERRPRLVTSSSTSRITMRGNLDDLYGSNLIGGNGSGSNSGSSSINGNGNGWSAPTSPSKKRSYGDRWVFIL